MRPLILLLLFSFPVFGGFPTAGEAGCRVQLAGIPFGLPEAILASLKNDKVYLPHWGEGDASPSQVSQWVQQYFHGGKRLRPLMVYLSSLVMGKASKEVEELAGIVELIHLGSLALDDIIDEATDRRGKVPLYKAEGLTAGIITGPWLQASVFQRAETVTNSAVRIEMARVLKAMGDGELLQARLKRRAQDGGTYSREDYEQVALGKTGHLFGFSLAISSMHFNLGSKLVSDWQKLGQGLGAAYQVKDDFEDAQAESREVNFALMLASQKWGGSPFRQITAEEHRQILVWQKPEQEVRRKEMRNILASIENQITPPHKAEQRAALDTLGDLIDYVTAP